MLHTELQGVAHIRAVVDFVTEQVASEQSVLETILRKRGGAIAATESGGARKGEAHSR